MHRILKPMDHSAALKYLEWYRQEAYGTINVRIRRHTLCN